MNDSQRKFLKTTALAGATLTLVFALSVSAASARETAATGNASLAEIDRKLNNPLTSLWSLTFQDNFGINQGSGIDGSTYNNVLFFQPALPVPVGQSLIYIGRPVFPLVTIPVSNPLTGEVTGHSTGFGDLQFFNLIGPSRSDGHVWGGGLTFKFPTASEPELGQGKYQAGPAAMFFDIGKPWIWGFLAQHWESFAGDDDRPETSRTDIQYVIRYILPDAWSVGMGPTVTIDWEAEPDDRLTLPIGLGVTKTVRLGKMPVKLRTEAHYSIIRPETFGEVWNIRFQVTPVIKSPFM